MKLIQFIRFPTISQWKKLPQALSQNEKIAASVFAVCFFGSALFLLHTLYTSHTRVVPAKGGSMTEGIVGTPHFINPIYSDANDADRDLSQLIFSGLFKYDAKGNIVPDLAKDYAIQDDGKTIEVNIKDHLAWSDGFPLNADDILFSINTIQDPRYKSPIRANWVGVTVEKVSDLKIRFKLSQPYAPFLERLTTKIIPLHIWQNITPENFALSVYNLQPVGSGPFRVKNLIREKSGSIKEIRLSLNSFYGGKLPYIQSLTFLFFENKDQLASSLKNNSVQAFSPDTPKDIPPKEDSAFETYEFSLPRYFALFFNSASKTAGDPTKQKDIRLALEKATDKKELAQKLFGDRGKTVDSPFLPDLFGFQAPEQQKASESDILALFLKYGYTKTDGKLVKTSQNSLGIQVDLEQGSKNSQEVKKLQACLAKDQEIYPDGTISGIFGNLTKEAVIKFQEKYAKEILEPQGLSKGTGKVAGATRQKLNALCFGQANDPIPFTIAISTADQYPLVDAANIIKEQWAKFGITAQIHAQNSAELERGIIKPRNYQILLFGELLGKIPDPFPFWHSSQKKDPGLNLSSYENKKLDTVLEQARKELDDAKRTALYQRMQTIVLADTPIITLFDAPYLYALPSFIKGVETSFIADPSQRFAGITDWYIKTKRAWK